MKTALICGISGQDGAYLAKLLLDRGYLVCGTSRDAQACGFTNLKRLGIFDRISFYSMSLIDFRSVLQILMLVGPDEIYNLSGQTSVGLSFEQPVETLESIATGTINILEAIRFTGQPIRYYNAASSECFGDTNGEPADEKTAFRPRSPYAVAKSTAYWATANYREAYGLFACSGILFNHESPLRPMRFVTQKIIFTACRISAGSGEKLKLGNMFIQRDWGWAPEYVEGMWRMLHADEPDDYILATGETHSLQDFVETAFACLDMDWHDYIETDDRLLRPTDLTISIANPGKARNRLGWKAQAKMKDVVRMMIDARLNEKRADDPQFTQIDAD